MTNKFTGLGTVVIAFLALCACSATLLLQSPEPQVESSDPSLIIEKQGRDETDVNALQVWFDENGVLVSFSLHHFANLTSYRLEWLRNSTDVFDGVKFRRIQKEIFMLMPEGGNRILFKDNDARMAAREVQCRLFFRLLVALDSRIVKGDRSDVLPIANMPLPEGVSGFPAGIDPKHIEDPTLRRQYEESIESNNLASLPVSFQIDIGAMREKLPRLFKMALSGDQSDKKYFEQLVLEVLLSEEIKNEELRSWFRQQFQSCDLK